VALAQALISAGVRILQYRHKEPWHQQHFDEARRIAGLCADAGVLFVMNDRADYARLLGAALHIGQDDLPPTGARTVMGDEVMGLSTHNREQLVAADGEQVEYISIGPIFATQSKARPDPVVGLEGLKQLRPLTEKPLCAIGGITLQNAGAVIAAGANAVAVISGLLPETGTSRPSVKQLQAVAAQWMELLGPSR
jgi:thiamine-phosphate pyrophosphorylase